MPPGPMGAAPLIYGNDSIIVQTEVPAASSSDTAVPPSTRVSRKRSPPTTSASLDIAWVAIPVARLCTSKESGRASHVVYDILVKAWGRSDDWYTYRRYSNFYQLHQSLPAHPNKPAIPPKRPFAWLTEKFIEERRAALEQYLQEILKYEDLRRCPQFRDFIGLTGTWSAVSGGRGSNYVNFPYSEASLYGMNRPREVFKSIMVVHAVKRLSPSLADAPKTSAAAASAQSVAIPRLGRVVSEDARFAKVGLVKYEDTDSDDDSTHLVTVTKTATSAAAASASRRPRGCFQPLRCSVM